MPVTGDAVVRMPRTLCSPPAWRWSWRRDAARPAFTRRTTSSRTSSTGASGRKPGSACRIRSGACCRPCSPTSCRPDPASGYERLGFLYESPQAQRPDRRDVRRRTGGARGLQLRDVSRRAATARPPARPAASCWACRRTRWTCRATRGSSRRAPRIRASTHPRSSRPSSGKFPTSPGSIASSITSPWSGGRSSGILDRARENAWFDRRPPQGPGPRRHLQPLQGAALARPAERPRRRNGGSAVAVEPADAARHVAALGRQQQRRRGTEQERRDRRRRDARLARPRVAGAHRAVDRGPSGRRRSRPIASIGRAPSADTPSIETACASCHDPGGARSDRSPTSRRSAPIRSGSVRSRRSWR